jgi:putative membrane protein
VTTPRGVLSGAATRQLRGALLVAITAGSVAVVVVAAAMLGMLVPVIVAVTAVAYVAGGGVATGALAGRRAIRRIGFRQAGCFFAGLATTLIALGPPLDGAADTWFWAHMTQHVLLLVVAPPLLVLGAPWVPVWRCLPLAVRRPVARWVMRSHAGRGARWLLGLPAAALGAFLVFNIDLFVWHWPALFDLTLRSLPVHYLEHFLFLATGMLFWRQVLPSWPLRERVGAGGRICLLIGAATLSWILAVILAFAPHALYSPYTTAPHGLDPVADQRIAAGVMWVPGSLPFAIALIWEVLRSVNHDGASTAATSRPGPVSLPTSTQRIS